MPKENANLDQRLKRLVQRFAQAQLSRVFNAWKVEAQFESSAHHLESLLHGCGDVFDKPAHARTEADLSAVLQLLQQVPLLSMLCPAAQRCIAAHARLMVLSDVAEMPMRPADDNQLYCVLCGSVTLVHGDAGDPQLQPLLQTAQQHQQQQVERAEAAAQLTNDAADIADSRHSENSRSSVCSSISETTSANNLETSDVGVWHKVKAAVAAAQKRQMHSSTMGQQQPPAPAKPTTNYATAAATSHHQSVVASATTAPAASDVQQQQQLLLQENETGPLLDMGCDSILNSLCLGNAGPGQTFCGSSFARGWTPTASATSPASPSEHDELGFLCATLPCSCLAAVAEPNTVVGLLAISKLVYMEASRLQHESHVSRIIDMLCRLPCLRHMPIKELHRLAAHMKEATYEPGQMLLKQGREVPDIHFLVHGTVLLTYAPPTNTTAAVAARISMAGPPNANMSTDPAASAAAAAEAIVAAVAAGRASIDDSGAVAAAKRSSGLADLLRLGQQAVQPATVVGARGPGAILGDDAVRERRIGVGVVAATKVVTLKVEPLKFLSCLDPLTLRLFGRLRPQQPPAQQKLIKDALQETDTADHPEPELMYRSAVLAEVYQSGHLPHTLVRPGDEGNGVPTEQDATGKPEWRVTRLRDVTGVHSKPRRLRQSSSGKPATCGGETRCQAVMNSDGSMSSARSTASNQSSVARGRGSQVVNPEDAAWERKLPRGLTVDKCAGLPHSASVQQLVEEIKSADEFRRMQGSLLLPSSDTVSMKLALSSIAPMNTSSSSSSTYTSAADWCPPLTSVRIAGANITSLNTVAGKAAASGAPMTMNPAALAAEAAAAASAGNAGSTVHTELLEACGIAVLQLSILPGQAAVTGGTLASALDDVAASWAAVAHDEELQLIRWGAKRWMLLAQLEPGTSKRAGLEGLADALLLSAARMAGVISRCEGLPALSLAAGMACGSCFMQHEAGNFVCSVSGHAYDAATELCTTAASMGAAATAQFKHINSAGSQIALLVSDGAANSLQTGFILEACNGGCLLIGARAGLPAAANAFKTGPAVPAARQTLGPGRHTMLGAALLGSCATPKSPGILPSLASKRAVGKAQQRRMMRRKFEALQDFFSGAADALPPPPEYMLTQPPPSAAAAMEGSSYACNGLSGTCSTHVKRQLRPRLTISVDGISESSASDLSTTTPGKTAKGVKQLSVEPSGALTPTLIMDSPRCSNQAVNGPDLLNSKQYNSRMSAVNIKTATLMQSPAMRAALQKDIAAASAMPRNSCSTTPSSNGSTRSNLRQQVWQEVADIRAAEVSIVGTVAGAALLHESSSNSSGSTGHSKAAFGSPMRWASNEGSSHGKVGLQLDMHLSSHSTESSLSGAVSSASTVATGGQGTSQTAIDSTTRSAAVRSGLKVTFQSPRNHSIVCVSSTARLAQHPTLHVSLQSKQQQHHQPPRQQMDREPSLQSVNSMSRFPDPADGSGSSSNLPGAAAQRAVEAAILQEQREQALVVSACKALGSVAAAESYVLSLPDYIMAVNLSAAGLSRLPAINHLTQLETLSASFNHLSCFPQLVPASEAAVAAAIAAAADTGSTGSSSGGLEPEAVAAAAAAVAEQLEKQLSSKDVSTLPVSLTQLGMAYNELIAVPVALPAALPELTALDLSHNRLTELPSTIGALSCVRQLFLGHNQLTHLPPSFTRLLLLQTLNLSHNKLTELSSNLDQLQNLSDVQLEHNQIHTLPACLSSLVKLNCLSVGYNQLEELPDGVLVELTGLTSLNLAGNKLTDSAMEAAVRASANVVPAAQLCDTPYPEACAAVIRSATDTAVTASPRSLSPRSAVAGSRPMSAAASRPLSAAAVTSPGVLLLPALQVLDISSNSLHALPSWLPSTLQRLIASGNRISQVNGFQLEQLSGSLMELDLQGNNLQDLPGQLKLMSQLEVLALNGNPGVDPEVADSGGGLFKAYKWLGAQKSAAVSAALRASNVLKPQQQQQIEVVTSVPGIRQTIIANAGKIAF